MLKLSLRGASWCPCLVGSLLAEAKLADIVRADSLLILDDGLYWCSVHSCTLLPFVGRMGNVTILLVLR